MGYAKSSSYRYGYYEEPQFTNLRNTNDKWKMEFSLFIGGEYFIIDKISLLIETSMESYYRKSKMEEKFIEWGIKDNYEIESWIASPEVRFGFSFYL